VKPFYSERIVSKLMAKTTSLYSPKTLLLSINSIWPKTTGVDEYIEETA
jgi:hypothetical protein